MIKNKLKEIIKAVVRLFCLIWIRTRLVFPANNKLPKQDGSLEKLHPKKKISCLVKERHFNNSVDLSFIVPLYNSEKFIEQCVESILSNKTKYSYEIILVNDGSTDNTETLMKKYKKKYPKIIKCVTKENGGIASAKNAGLNSANGKYIAFIDHDDYIDNQFVRTMLNIAFNKNADIVKCGTADVKNGRIISIAKYGNKEILDGMGMEILTIPSYIWGGIYKNTLLKNVQFPEGYWYEDMIWRFFIYRNSKHYVSIDEVHHYRGCHDNQASKKVWKNNSPKCLDHLYLLETLIKDNNLGKDSAYYANILLESTTILLKRIKGLSNEAKQQVFLRVSEIANTEYNESFANSLTSKWKIKDKILRKKYYKLWLLLQYL